MSELLLFFGLAAALAAALANIGIWSPRRLWVKLSAVIVVALFLPLSYGAMTELLSRPKPVGIEWAQRTVPKAVVLGSRMVEDKAIYLWLGLEGLEEPRAYALPWSQDLAEQLFDAQRKAKAAGTNVIMRQPFERTMDETEQVFYADPRQAPRPKQVTQQEGPLMFQGTERKATTSN